jgi:hypothetical protein
MDEIGPLDVEELDTVLTRRASMQPPARNDLPSNRRRAPAFDLSMTFAQTLRVCREGKPAPTFPDLL